MFRVFYAKSTSFFEFLSGRFHIYAFSTAFVSAFNAFSFGLDRCTCTPRLPSFTIFSFVMFYPVWLLIAFEKKKKLPKHHLLFSTLIIAESRLLCRCTLRKMLHILETVRLIKMPACVAFSLIISSHAILFLRASFCILHRNPNVFIVSLFHFLGGKPFTLNGNHLNNATTACCTFFW